jgi:hypothetical protein
MTSRLQNRRDTAANWTTNNPTLAQGEIGYETDTGKFKIGTGSANWTTLGYTQNGTVTSIVAGTGLSGGTITSTGTVALSTPVSVANGGTGISSFGTGVATFLGTPSSANLATAVTDETGSGVLVFGTSPTIATPVITNPKITLTYTAKTAAYTFVSGDEGGVFSMNNAAAQQFNIPVDATFNFAIGTQFNVFWLTGAGQPTIGAVTPGTTTVISTGATSATPKLRVANSMATCLKIAANSWIVTGDVA